MAIDLTVSYIQNAHRLSLYELHPDIRKDTKQEIFAGQLFELESDGDGNVYWVYAKGNKKAYPTLNNRYGTSGAYDSIQHQYSEGRDDVTRSGKLAVLKGNFEIATDQYEVLTGGNRYNPGDALKVKNNSTFGAAGEVVANRGILTKWDSATDSAAEIVGYVTVPPNFNQPVVTHGMNTYPQPTKPFLRYEG
jgi:hypothetical protein